jgi:hypothetical protein
MLLNHCPFPRELDTNFSLRKKGNAFGRHLYRDMTLHLGSLFSPYPVIKRGEKERVGKRQRTLPEAS